MRSLVLVLVLVSYSVHARAQAGPAPWTGAFQEIAASVLKKVMNAGVARQVRNEGAGRACGHGEEVAALVDRRSGALREQIFGEVLAHSRTSELDPNQVLTVVVSVQLSIAAARIASEEAVSLMKRPAGDQFAQFCAAVRGSLSR